MSLIGCHGKIETLGMWTWKSFIFGTKILNEVHWNGILRTDYIKMFQTDKRIEKNERKAIKYFPKQYWNGS